MQIHHRRSIRLQEYDYTHAGAYFVTLVTHQRANLFGEILDKEMRLNEFGIIFCEECEKTPIIRPEMDLDIYQIMPNHFHAIFVIHDIGINNNPTRNVDIQPQRQPRSLGSCIAGLKSITTKRINQVRQSPGEPVWQRNYYEHILRNQDEWQRARAYIQANPLNWQIDHENVL